jgi:hypothetical protein
VPFFKEKATFTYTMFYGTKQTMEGEQVSGRFSLASSFSTAIETPSWKFSDSPQGSGLEDHRLCASACFSNDAKPKPGNDSALGLDRY